MAGTKIMVTADINATRHVVWDYWTNPKHIINWNHASDDWHSPRAENNLTAGGKFNIRMEAKDGSSGFDFEGTYICVIQHHLIAYSLADGREVNVTFTDNGTSTSVTEEFDAEHENSAEMQREGWQAILNNFKKYTENNN